VSANASMRAETSLVFLISALHTPGDCEGFGCVKGPRVSGLWLHHVNAAAPHPALGVPEAHPKTRVSAAWVRTV